MRRRRSSVNDPRIVITNALVAIDDRGFVEASGAVTEMQNQGLGGAGYDLDVVVGTGANLKKSISNCMLCYAASGDYGSGAVLSITANAAIAAYIDPFDITPAAISTIAAQSTAGQIAFESVILTDGKLRLTISNDGTTVVNGDSTASIAGGEWVLSVWDDTADDVNFYTAPGSPGSDPTTLTWTQLGNADIALASSGMHDSSAVLEIGGNTSGTSEGLSGNIGRVMIWSGTTSVTAGTLTAGTEEADSNPSLWTTGTTYASGGDTYILNNNVFIQNTGHNVVHSIGNAGLESTAGQTIFAPYTVFLVARSSITPLTSDAYFTDARSDGAKRVIILSRNLATDQFSTYEGSFLDQTGGYDNDLHVHALQYSADASTKYTVSGVSEVTGSAGTYTYWDYGNLFSDVTGTNSAQGYIAALYVFDYQLSETQVSAIQTYLASEYKL